MKQWKLIQLPQNKLIHRIGAHTIYVEDLHGVYIRNGFVTANAIDAMHVLCCELEPKLLHVDTALAINLIELGFHHSQCNHKLCQWNSDTEGNKFISMEG